MTGRLISSNIHISRK